MRRAVAVVLIALGALCTVGAGLAGWVNRQVLDGPTFVANVDEVRRDPAVTAAVGDEVADAVVAANPDLVAVQPLVGQVAAGVVGSQAAEPLVRLAASQVHGVLVSGDGDELVLRLADVGAVVSATLRTVSPDAAAAIPATLPVTLAQVGGRGGPLGPVVQSLHVAGVLAWLLPLLAIGFLVTGGLVHPVRRRGFVQVGTAVVAAGAALLLLALGVALWARGQDTGTLTGAVRDAAWQAAGPALATTATLTLLLGGLTVAVATASLPDVEVARAVGAVRRWIVGRPGTVQGAVARAVVLLVLGLGLVLATEETVRAVAIVAGVVAVATAVLELDRVVGRLDAARQGPDRATAARSAPRRRWLVPVLLGGAGVLVVGTLLARGARPADDVPLASPQGPLACNGHAELCDRSYDDVVVGAAHNAMSAADAGFYLAEQPTGMVGLLDLGVRGLLVDTWYGQPTEGGKAITAGFQFAEATRKAEETFGPEVMGSVTRLVTSVQSSSGAPSGPVQPYLCHTFCELGGTPLLPALQELRAWLAAHPSEVVTMVVQDTVTPDDTAAAFDEAGLLPFVHTPADVAAPWPTLRQMVDSGQRLVVLMENRGGDTEHPWLLPASEYVQDTDYTFPTADDFTCTLNRGTAAAPLFLVNHWLSGFTSLYTDAEQVNAFAVLDDRVRTCEAERGRTANLVAVNWVDLGDLQRVVDAANGL